MPYTSKGKCVYRADTGKKVGCTKGPVKKYLAALHANVPDAKEESVNEITYGSDPSVAQWEYKYVIDHLPDYSDVSKSVHPQAAIARLDDLVLAAYNLGRKDESDTTLRREKDGINETANNPANYQSAISAMATAFAQNRGIRANLSEYSPAEVISIIYGVEVQKAQAELTARIQQKLTKAQARGIHESTCQACGGDGWYAEPDEKGNPKQVQCHACQGQGKTDDPDPQLRASGEPKNEPFNESAPISSVMLGSIVQEMMNQHIYQLERDGKIRTYRTTGDALGAARECFPDIRNKKIMPVKNGHVTTIGDITVTEIYPFIG